MKMKRWVAIMLVLVSIVSILPTFWGVGVEAEAAADYGIQIGDKITLGKYLGEPIVWVCVDIDENGPLMLSEKILCLKAYDAKGEDEYYHNDGWGYIRKTYGSNCWEDSNLRQWLNSTDKTVKWSHCPPTTTGVIQNAYDDEPGFLTNFASDERSLIKKVTQKVTVNAWETKREGYCDHYGSTDRVLGTVMQPSFRVENHHYANVTDRMFLLTASQINRINQKNPKYLQAAPTASAVANSQYQDVALTEGSNWNYWTCISSGNDWACFETQLFMNADGVLGYQYALYGSYGVRPAFYLDIDQWNKGTHGTLVNHNGTWYYVYKGKVDDSYTGLCKFNGTWYYVKQGKVSFTTTTLVKYHGEWFYVANGKVASKTTSLVKYNGEWWYVVNGKVASKTTALVKYNGEWWYVVNGKLASKTTTLVKYGGEWFYVVNGKLASKTTALVKYSGQWWYVVGGKISTKTTSLVKYNNEWWYVVNGKIASKTTSLVKHNGEWWYVTGGKIASKTTTLVAYNGGWYYIVKGKLAAKTTKLVWHGGNWYYVRNGKVDFSQSP